MHYFWPKKVGGRVYGTYDQYANDKGLYNKYKGRHLKGPVAVWRGTNGQLTLRLPTRHEYMMVFVYDAEKFTILCGPPKSPEEYFAIENESCRLVVLTLDQVNRYKVDLSGEKPCSFEALEESIKRGELEADIYPIPPPIPLKS